MEISNKILSDITVYMKYAKFLPGHNRRENWEEIVRRNKEMHIRKFPNLEDEINEAYAFVYRKEVLPSMRSMQFAGRPIEINPSRIYNCAYLPVDDWRAFAEIMFLLLGGTGIGFSVQTHHIENLPDIHKPRPDKSRRWLIADSIEGWADAIKALMKSYFFGGSSIRFDFSDIRPKGARLITAGGKAPGPAPLRECLAKIEGILEAKEDGEKLKSIEVHDIVCHIADAVLAGGIRRAALISLFNADDDEMIACKSGAWWEMNPQRGRANNSAVLLRHRVTEKYFFDLWKRIELSNSGEPGIYFTNDKDWGTNPCCLTGDTLLKVRDINANGLGDEYNIPLGLLVEKCETSWPLPFIQSFNEETRKVEWKQITVGKLMRTTNELIEIDTGTNTIQCTPDHRIYTTNRGWVEAQYLEETDELLENIL